LWIPTTRVVAESLFRDPEDTYDVAVNNAKRHGNGEEDRQKLLLKHGMGAFAETNPKDSKS
jgi:hypothetical protein